MIYTKNTKKALKLAFEKHYGQVDISGVPYIFHPFYIAEKMDDEDSTIVALLHDVIEDTDTSLDDLKKLNFNNNIIEALSYMTHHKNIDYFDYIKNLSNNSLALKVKIEDIKHNMDLTRLNIITEKDKFRLEKYKKALEYLQNKLAKQ